LKLRGAGTVALLAGRIGAGARELGRQCRLRDLAPLVLPLALSPWIVVSLAHFVHHTLYFDPANYQYTAWCIRHGERLYDSVGVPDGPFITMLHALVQSLVGESDQAFRRADLWIHGLGAAAIGAVLAPRAAERGRAVVVRLVWALVGASLWLAYYLTFDWYWTVQREAYYALFGFLGAALLYASPSYAPRAGRAAAFAGGALVGMQLFGKHSGVIFVACGLAAVAIGRGDDATARRARVVRAVAGVAAGALLMLACIAVWGSLRGFWFWYFKFPAAYRNAMVGADALKLFLEGNAAAQELAAYALFGGLVAIATGLLPRRAVGFTVAPAAFYLAMALQRKGYPYHLHPVHAGACVLALIVLGALWGYRGDAPAAWSRPHALAATIAVALIGARGVAGLRAGPWLHPLPHEPDSTSRAPHENYAAMGDVARFLKARTGPHERIFTYGPAPDLLLKAERALAVPEFNNYFFNVRRATTVPLSASERRSLDRLQAAIADDACPRLKHPPAAMVFCDAAAWSGGPGVDDASEVCPEIRDMLRTGYKLEKTAGCWRVYVRADNAGPSSS
jgi:hypothetical protein